MTPCMLSVERGRQYQQAQGQGKLSVHFSCHAREVQAWYCQDDGRKMIRTASIRRHKVAVGLRDYQ